MKKENEKQPVDDLFARKLKNMQLPPSPNGFVRLQARMRQGQPETRMVFWREPQVQRYMAMAACLLLVCLFSWLYLSTDTLTPGQPGTVAVNKPAVVPATQLSSESMKKNSANNVITARPGSGQKTPVETDANPNDSERTELAVDVSMITNKRVAHLDRTPRKTNEATQGVPTKTPEQLAKMDVTKSVVETAVENTENAPAIAVATAKPAPVAERVLIVTIAEPEALIAARQAAKTQEANNAVAVVTDKSEKDAKPATLWQQMKRLKQGEVFARKDAGEEERGLIGRAYTGIKQTLDKEKSVKQ